jgi:hypothetical protein
MGICHLCSKGVDLPFRCHHCGESFCPGHMLPEAHNCPNVKWGKDPLAPLPPPIIKTIEEIEIAEPVRKLLEEKEAKVKELEKELTQMKDEKKRLDAEQAIKEEKSTLINFEKERKWQLNGLLKLNERWYKDGVISAKEYIRTKKKYEQDLKKLEKSLVPSLPCRDK